MSYTYPTDWATMAKKEKEKFAQTSITLEMVEIAQEYVPDLFGKFSKTKTASVIKKLRKEVSVNSYVWGSYSRPSETPIPVLMQVFNSVINVFDLINFINDTNDAEMATVRSEVARETAERDDAEHASPETKVSEMEEGWTLSAWVDAFVTCMEEGVHPMDAFLHAKDNSERAKIALDACCVMRGDERYFCMGDTIYRKCDFEAHEGYFNHMNYRQVRARHEMKGNIALYRVTSTQVWESDFGNEYLDGGDFDTDSGEEYYDRNEEEMRVWRDQQSSQAWLVAKFVACITWETEFPDIDCAPFCPTLSIFEKLDKACSKMVVKESIPEFLRKLKKEGTK